MFDFTCNSAHSVLQGTVKIFKRRIRPKQKMIRLGEEEAVIKD